MTEPSGTHPLPADLTTLAEARSALAGRRCWIITDGKMGDIAPCLGIAERLGLHAQSRIIAPRRPWIWAMPWGPVDPREAPGRPRGPLAPPFPDIAIGAGRRAAAYIRALRRISKGTTFTVFLRDARTGAHFADLIWVPEHDRLRGDSVITSLTTPHPLSPEELAAARLRPRPWPDQPGRANLALILGGNSRGFHFTAEDETRLISDLVSAMRAGVARLLVTPSRRTPESLARRVAELANATGGYFWDGRGENPYRLILAHADVVIVTAESINLMGEAVATGKPVLFFRPSGASRKIDQFRAALEQAGALRPFQGRLEAFSYPPIDATPAIAIEIARRFVARLPPEKVS